MLHPKMDLFYLPFRVGCNSGRINRRVVSHEFLFVIKTREVYDMFDLGSKTTTLGRVCTSIETSRLHPVKAGPLRALRALRFHQNAA